MLISGKQIKDLTITQNKLNLVTPIAPADAATKEYVDNHRSVERLNTEDRNMNLSGIVPEGVNSYVSVPVNDITSDKLTNSTIEVYVNTTKVDVGPSEPFQFRSQLGVIRDIGDEEQGDSLFVNTLLSGYGLDTTDTIDFNYIISQTGTSSTNFFGIELDEGNDGNDIMTITGQSSEFNQEYNIVKNGGSKVKVNIDISGSSIVFDMETEAERKLTLTGMTNNALNNSEMIVQKHTGYLTSFDGINYTWSTGWNGNGFSWYYWNSTDSIFVAWDYNNSEWKAFDLSNTSGSNSSSFISDLNSTGSLAGYLSNGESFTLNNSLSGESIVSTNTTYPDEITKVPDSTDSKVNYGNPEPWNNYCYQSSDFRYVAYSHQSGYWITFDLAADVDLRTYTPVDNQSFTQVLNDWDFITTSSEDYGDGNLIPSSSSQYVSYSTDTNPAQLEFTSTGKLRIANDFITQVNDNTAKTSGLVNWTETNGHILPNTNADFDIGSAEKKVRHLFLSDNSLWVGDDHKIDTKDGVMKFKKRNKSIIPKSILDEGHTEEMIKEYFGVGSLSDISTYDWIDYANNVAGIDKQTPSELFENNEDYDIPFEFEGSLLKHIEKEKEKYENNDIPTGVLAYSFKDDDPSKGVYLHMHTPIGWVKVLMEP